jgi:hypothetical protein
MSLRSCLMCRGRYDRRVMIALDTNRADACGAHDPIVTMGARIGGRVYVCARPECSESPRLAQRAGHALGTQVSLGALATARQDMHQAEGTGGDHLG